MSDQYKPMITKRLLDEGFSLTGYVNHQEALFDDWLTPWLKKGYHGQMGWMENHAHLRRDPCSIEPWGRSIIVAAYPYHTPLPEFWKHGQNPISNYAWGQDYHVVLKKKLLRVVNLLSKEIEGFQARICIDTVPIPEKVLAMKAGLGWIGKNSMLINRKQGSYLFLGEIITNLELSSSEVQKDYCGTCQKCLEACPAQAIRSDRVVDSNRCISYLTIEKRGDFTPEEKKLMEYQVFGCDICQQVCPWNRKAPVLNDPYFSCNEKWGELSWDRLSSLTEEQYNHLKIRSPIKRTKYDGFERNLKATSSRRAESSD